MERREIPHDPCHIGVTLGASKMISEPMIRLAQTVHLTYVTVSTISKRTENEHPLEPRDLGVPSGASEKISEPMVHSAQIVHLSCVKISTISKRTKTSLHLRLVSYEYHRVRPKRFLCLWYVWCKPCNYLAPTLTLSPKGPKQDSTRPTSPRSSIECVQTDFQAYGMFDAKSATILH